VNFFFVELGVDMNRFTAQTFVVLASFAIPLASHAADVNVASSDTIFTSRFEQYTLAINNYLAWCTVSVNGGAPNSAAQISVALPDSSVAVLHGDAVSATFIWGYWTGTEGDLGGGDHNHDATVTMSSDKNVLACCPFASNPGAPCT